MSPAWDPPGLGPGASVPSPMFCSGVYGIPLIILNWATPPTSRSAFRHPSEAHASGTARRTDAASSCAVFVVAAAADEVPQAPQTGGGTVEVTFSNAFTATPYETDATTAEPNA